MSLEPGQLAEILMIDDDPGDVRITQEALRDARMVNQLHVAKDGEEGMRFLRKEGEFADAVRPDLIFLDINMPRKNGFETLEEIRADPDLKSIPIVMLTTSSADQDIISAYEKHANCFVSKPVDLDAFMEAIKELENFWMGVVHLPPKP